MKVSRERQTRHLVLSELSADLRLAQRLSPEVAFRYHALPVAERDGCITVAMANPDDGIAREAVSTALGTTPYLVEADPEAIDALLVEIWPEKSDRRLHMLVCDNLEVQDEGSGNNYQTSEVWEYATALGDLLNAEVSRFCPPPKAERVLHAMTEDLVRVGHGLVVVGEGQQPPLAQLLFGSIEKKVVERIPASVLVARRPRWPLDKILLAARCHDSDDIAADWVIPLARRSGAAVTILTIMPPLPVMYQTSIEALLAHNTASGKQLRQLAGRLEQWNIPGTVCLRQGEPDWQIQSETSEGNYDLIVVAAERTSKLQRLLLGEIVGPLLDWADRPVLIAQPRQITERSTNNE